MCKIMIIPGIQPEYNEAAKVFARAARGPLVKHDKHAFGYAALGTHGLFGERWTEVKEATRDHATAGRAHRAFTKSLGDIAREPTKFTGGYSSFGETSEKVSAYILHARTATTGGQGIENAHPFIRDGHALIHNGMIHNSHALKNITSTCDSETILNAYIDAKVTNDMDAFDRIAAVMRGWYAVGMLVPTEAGYTVDVIRDDTTSLQACYVDGIDAVVFCTRADIIKEAAKRAGMRAIGTHDIPAETYLRIDAYTGELLSKKKFTVAKYSFQTEYEKYSDVGIVDYGYGGRGRRRKDRYTESFPAPATTETAEEKSAEKIVEETVARALNNGQSELIDDWNIDQLIQIEEGLKRQGFKGAELNNRLDKIIDRHQRRRGKGRLGLHIRINGSNGETD